MDKPTWRPPLNIRADEYLEALAELEARRRHGGDKPEGRELLRLMEVVETWESMLAGAMREYEYSQAFAELEVRLDHGGDIDPESPEAQELLRLVDIVEGYEGDLLGPHARLPPVPSACKRGR